MDKLIKEALLKEEKRQNNNIELIASENYVSKDILEYKVVYLLTNMLKDIQVKDIMVDVRMLI
jgi:glycine/serine hydroxymethyltransferase